MNLIGQPYDLGNNPCYYGIRIANASYTHNTISGNNIYNARYGIALLQNSPTYDARITNNAIWSIGSDLCFAGITVQDQLVPPISKVEIDNNTIYLNGSNDYIGVSVNSCKGKIFTAGDPSNYQIHDNHVNKTNFSNIFYAGFSYTQNTQIESYNNTVSGGSTQSTFFSQGFPQGYYSFNNLIRHRCNEVSGTYVGAGFYGVNNNNGSGQANNVAQGFNFINNSTGLWVTLNATIPSQDIAGNEWSGSFNGLNAARNDNYSTIQTLSLFTQERFTATAPNTSVFWPRSGSAASETPAGWFTIGNGTPISCPAPVHLFSYTPGDSKSLDYTELNSLDSAVITDSIQFVTYNESLKWQNAKVVYDKLVTNPNLIDSANIDSFFLMYQNAPLGKLNAIENAKDDALSVSSTDAYKLGDLYYTRDSLIQIHLVADSVMLDSTTNDSLKFIVLAAWDSISLGVDSTIDTISSQIQSIIDPPTKGGNLAITTIVSLARSNDSIISTLKIEENLKLFNQIYLATTAQFIDTFTASQISNLHYLANQCPLDGGEAVFRARSLLTLVNDSTFYDNDSICADTLTGHGYFMMAKRSDSTDFNNSNDSVGSKENLKVVLYPNPAKDYAVLQLNQDVVPLELRIVDGLGNVAFNRSVSTSKGYYIFSTSTLGSGIYYISLTNDGVKIFSGKLAIFK